MLGDQLATCGDAVSCGCGCGGKGCCKVIVFRKGYAFKRRYKVVNKTTGACIDFTGKRVLAQVRPKRSSTDVLASFSTDTGQITGGIGFIEISAAKEYVEAQPWSDGILELAVEWTPGVPEYQFTAPVRVEMGIRL
jgi:hypothetical protein